MMTHTLSGVGAGSMNILSHSICERRNKTSARRFEMTKNVKKTGKDGDEAVLSTSNVEE